MLPPCRRAPLTQRLQPQPSLQASCAAACTRNHNTVCCSSHTHTYHKHLERASSRQPTTSPVLPIVHSPPRPAPLFFCPPLMLDCGKRLRRAASAAKPPAPLQVALARCPPEQTKRACAGPCGMTLPGEGSGGDGVKVHAGQGRAGGVVKRKRCEHGRVRSRCKDCGGGSVCEHGRQRSSCKDCGGSGICEHGRERSRCKDCGGSGICEHGRQRSRCKDCGGSSICEHGRQKSRCKDCGGSSICEHGRERRKCKDCGGRGICEHGRQRSKCKDCGGSGICEHGRQRSHCKDCEGSSLHVRNVSCLMQPDVYIS